MARQAKLVLAEAEALQWTLCDPMLREVVVAGLRAWPAHTMVVADDGIFRPGDADGPRRLLELQKVLETTTDAAGRLVLETAIEEVKSKMRSGIHAVPPPYRALDGSGRNLARNRPAQWEVCGKIATAVNRFFVYDPRRPEKLVAVGAKHGTGPHVHFQVHPRTVRARQS